jgi:pimeloyl-ACP methyl ester carboxylesterase
MNFPLAAFRFGNQLGSIFTPSRTVKKAGTLFLTPKRFPIKDWEVEAEKLGQRFMLDENISAIRWHANSDHKRDNQKQILLVHGWESRATQMYGVAKQLLSTGFDVVAVDMPGHGHSKGNTSNPHMFAQTIQLAQQKLGHFEAIVGHSMGAGASAIAVGRGVSTQKLVLISGPSSIENVLRQFAGFIGLNKKGINKFVEFISNVVGASPQDLDTQILLKNSNIPTLVIHDEQDLEVPASESKRLASVLKNVELFLSNDLGHRKILKSQEILQKVVSFIK